MIEVEARGRVDTAPLVARLVWACRTLGVRRASIGLMVVDAEEMAAINGEHRGTPEPTDVLAFPVDGPEAMDWPDEGPPPELGDVFSAAGGAALVWHPDQVLTSPQAGGGSDLEIAIDRIVLGEVPPPGVDSVASAAAARSEVIEQRQVCVTAQDVAIARIHLVNPTQRKAAHRVEITGDCRNSRNWRGKPGGVKETRKTGDFVVLIDRNVFCARSAVEG